MLWCCHFIFKQIKKSFRHKKSDKIANLSHERFSVGDCGPLLLQPLRLWLVVLDEQILHSVLLILLKMYCQTVYCLENRSNRSYLSIEGRTLEEFAPPQSHQLNQLLHWSLGTSIAPRSITKKKVLDFLEKIQKIFFEVMLFF